MDELSQQTKSAEASLVLSSPPIAFIIGVMMGIIPGQLILSLFFYCYRRSLYEEYYETISFERRGRISLDKSQSESKSKFKSQSPSTSTPSPKPVRHLSNSLRKLVNMTTGMTMVNEEENSSEEQTKTDKTAETNKTTMPTASLATNFSKRTQGATELNKTSRRLVTQGPLPTETVSGDECSKITTGNAGKSQRKKRKPSNESTKESTRRQQKARAKSRENNTGKRVKKKSNKEANNKKQPEPKEEPVDMEVPSQKRKSKDNFEMTNKNKREIIKSKDKILQSHRKLPVLKEEASDVNVNDSPYDNIKLGDLTAAEKQAIIKQMEKEKRAANPTAKVDDTDMENTHRGLKFPSFRKKLSKYTPPTPTGTNEDNRPPPMVIEPEKKEENTGSGRINESKKVKLASNRAQTSTKKAPSAVKSVKTPKLSAEKNSGRLNMGLLPKPETPVAPVSTDSPGSLDVPPPVKQTLDPPPAQLQSGSPGPADNNKTKTETY